MLFTKLQKQHVRCDFESGIYVLGSATEQSSDVGVGDFKVINLLLVFKTRNVKNCIAACVSLASFCVTLASAAKAQTPALKWQCQELSATLPNGKELHHSDQNKTGSVQYSRHHPARCMSKDQSQ